jgi:uncharacterized protein (TIGR02594 family)
MGVYLIKPGDTFYDIAGRYGMTPSGLLALNPFIENPNRIFPGQSINVPDPAPSPDQPPQPQPPDASQGDPIPPWLAIAYGELGQREIPGPAENQRINEYHAATTLGRVSEKWAWCSSFVNWVMAQAGFEPTRSAAAKSWLKWSGGRLLDLAKENPRLGDIVVFHRGKSWQGHVGFYVGEYGGYIKVLGGNQKDQVSIRNYSRKKLAGVIRPNGV